jgi:TRAP-type C4-dicarboxylate transport system substrate-binding protein
MTGIVRAAAVCRWRISAQIRASLIGRILTGVWLAIFAFGSSGICADELLFLSPFPRNFPLTSEVTERFINEVRKQAGADLQFKHHGPDVVPPFHQFEPVQAGLFDLLLTSPAYHSGSVPAVTALGGIGGEKKEWRAAGLWQALDDLYRARHLKLLALTQMGTRSAQIVLREPIGRNGLAGRKIRGTLTYQHMIRAMGGVPVSLPSHEIFAGLERGVIDGAAIGVVGAQQLKLHEVTDYLLRPTFGVLNMIILNNLDSWERLDSRQQRALLDAGESLEDQVVERIDALQRQEEEILLDAGMRFTVADDDLASRFEGWYANGMWVYALKEGGAEADRLLELVRKADLLIGGAIPADR